MSVVAKRPDCTTNVRTILRNKPVLIGKDIFSVKSDDRLLFSWQEISKSFDAFSSPDCRNRTVIFVRHGQTEYNRQNKVTGVHNTRLSQEGKNQAKRLAIALSDQEIKAVFSSPLDRAVETASIFVRNRKLDLDLVQDFRLREVNLGLMQGWSKRPRPEFAKGNIDYYPKDGESYRTASRRVASFLVSLGTNDYGTNGSSAIMVFAHAGVMRIIRTFFENTKTSKRMFSRDFLNAESLNCQLKDLHVPRFWRKGPNQHGFY